MVEIDAALLEEARRLSGARTKRAAIEAGLRALIRKRLAEELADLAGRVSIGLSRDRLEAMREGR